MCTFTSTDYLKCRFIFFKTVPSVFLAGEQPPYPRAASHFASMVVTATSEDRISLLKAFQLQVMTEEG